MTRLDAAASLPNSSQTSLSSVDIRLLAGSPAALVAATRESMQEAVAPVVVETDSAELAASCLQAGASAIDGGPLSDPAILHVIEEADASVMLSAPADADPVAAALERARWAEAAGLNASQILVRVSVEHVSKIAGHGYPAVVTTRGDDATQQGQHVVAAMAGARVIETESARATKRTVSTVGELLMRRGVSAPNGVRLVGTN